jgi:hypothetical protein
MNIHDEAVTAALKATNEAGYHHITALSVAAILEAAAPHLLKNMRRMDLHEIEMRDNPERMKKARSEMRKEVREIKREEIRQIREEAWKEGMLAQWEADLLSRPCEPNPYKTDKLA